ncbi:MAG TPA: DUF6526 family protein [Thermoanaerobaculia bacterium]|nr:DUF6526 family protein [Thermoanaerobaculia bacterium]
MPEQNFANHRKFVPGYHYVLAGLLVVNLVWSLYRLFRGLPGVPVFDRLLAVAVAVALVLAAAYLRTFPLRAQDRLIRLEETLRMERLLPPDLKARIGELRPGQVVALRFASDGELPDLTRAVLDEKIGKQNDIKKRIRSWRADHFRL